MKQVVSGVKLPHVPDALFTAFAVHTHSRQIRRTEILPEAQVRTAQFGFRLTF